MTSRGGRYWSSGAIPLIAPEMQGDIIAAACDLAVVVTPEGRVLSVLVGGQGGGYGAGHAGGGGATIGPLDHWEGTDLRRHLTAQSVPKLDAALAGLAAGREPPRPAELNHTDAAAPDLPVRYSFHRIGSGGAVLMLGRDLRPVADMQQRLVRAQLALERDYEAGRALETRYRVLLASVREPIVFVALGTGRIADLNAPAAELLGARATDLAGAALAGEFEGRRRAELMEALGAGSADDPSPVTACARRSGRELVLRSVPFRSGGERFALLRLEAPGSVAAEGGVGAAMVRLFADGADAMAIADARGVLRQANEAFLALVDAAGPAAVEGRSLADFLARGSADLRVLTESAARAGALRLYSTALVTAFGGRVAVEISATALGDADEGEATGDGQGAGHGGNGHDHGHGASEAARGPTPEGYAFVIRDADRAGALRGETPSDGATLGDGLARSVSEMVGSAPLRDIVAETADAVERLCIRTAVDLTGNNRVAAAEMLGLSRQSLYVKLRKFGLLSKDGED